MRIALPQDDLDLIISITPEFWSRFDGARIFITGGTGFIGMWLLEVMQYANDRLGSRIELVVLSRNIELARKHAPYLFNRPDTTLLAGDICNVCPSPGKLDLCIHAATDVGDPSKAGDPLGVFDSIVLGTRRILDLAHSSGASRFLLTSSGAVYGPQPSNMERIAETYGGAPDSLLPSSAYGNGKRAAEWLATTIAAQSGFEACVARIFALIGPGLPLNGNFAAGNFVRDALAGQVITIQGDGRPLRSYLYMADLCIWLLRILSSGRSGQAYNVGSERSVSIADLAGQVINVAGSNGTINIQTPVVRDTPAPRYVPDTFKARTELDLVEYTPLNVALLKTIHWSRLSTSQ